MVYVWRNLDIVIISPKYILDFYTSFLPDEKIFSKIDVCALTLQFLFCCDLC